MSAVKRKFAEIDVLEFSSPILQKYAKEISEAVSKMGRNEKKAIKKTFEEKPWNTIKITQLCTILSKEDFFLYLSEIGFIDHSKLKCKKCKGPLTLQFRSRSKDGVYMTCKNKIKEGGREKLCGSSRSCRSNTWFSYSQVTLAESLIFVFRWWNRDLLTQIQKELFWASHTLVDWSSFCRDVAIEIVLKNSEPIGGPGIVVEIDESKFGKRKYHRGKFVDGQWVFGGVERRTGRCFLVAVKDRSEATLLALIKQWILPGSIILSDCWKAYSNIQNHNDYTHMTVNHEQHYKDPITGTHTNTVEGMWHLVKASPPPTNRSKHHFLGYLTSYKLRRKWRKKTDGFKSFMRAAAEMHHAGYSPAETNESTQERHKLAKESDNSKSAKNVTRKLTRKAKRNIEITPFSQSSSVNHAPST